MMPSRSSFRYVRRRIVICSRMLTPAAVPNHCQHYCRPAHVRLRGLIIQDAVSTHRRATALGESHYGYVRRPCARYRPAHSQDPRSEASGQACSTDHYQHVIGQAIFQLTVTFILYFAGENILGYDGSKHRKLELSTMVFNTFVWMQIFNEFNNRRLETSSTFSRACSGTSSSSLSTASW